MRKRQVLYLRWTATKHFSRRGLTPEQRSARCRLCVGAQETRKQRVLGGRRTPAASGGDWLFFDCGDESEKLMFEVIHSRFEGGTIETLPMRVNTDLSIRKPQKNRFVERGPNVRDPSHWEIGKKMVSRCFPRPNYGECFIATSHCYCSYKLFIAGPLRQFATGSPFLDRENLEFRADSRMRSLRRRTFGVDARSRTVAVQVGAHRVSGTVAAAVGFLGLPS